MGAGWVAGSVRARGLLQHRVGAETVRLVARSDSLESAAGILAAAGVLPPLAQAPGLEGAQRAMAANLALQVRLLAAWLPRDGAGALRALASWFELANIEDRLAYLGGAELRMPFELGVLSTVWADAAATQSADELRRLLAGSSWGDPGGTGSEDVHLALRLAWARRVSVQVPAARRWAAGAVALLLAGELFVAGRHADDDLVRRVRLGRGWAGAATVAELRAALPPTAAWALAGVEQEAGLWQAELGWWRRVAADAEAMTRGRLEGSGVVVGAVALLAFDTMLLGTALAAAATGGGTQALEVVDALC